MYLLSIELYSFDVNFLFVEYNFLFNLNIFSVGQQTSVVCEYPNATRGVSRASIPFRIFFKPRGLKSKICMDNLQPP
jgi:hypothetical protein